MTQFHPRTSAPDSLATLQLNPTMRVAIDEIAALRLHKPSVADYATFIRHPPSVADMVERARIHAAEVNRFVKLANHTAPNIVKFNLAQLYALVLLNTASTAAVALMPARNGADRHARRQQGIAFIQSLDNPQDNDLRHLGEVAFGLPNPDAVTITQDAIAFAGRRDGGGFKTSRATVHRIEEQATLQSWLKRQVDVAAIFGEAQDHAVMVDRLAASPDHDELHPQDRDEIATAYEGALFQHVLALAELALAPVAIDTDLIFDASHATITTRPQLQAGLLIAIAVGQHYRAMLDANPC